MTSNLRLWNRLHCLAFDDVIQEVADFRAGADPELLADARHLAAHFLHALAGAEDLQGHPGLQHRVEMLLRGTLFVRFGERVCFWMDRLSRVEGEYERRVGALRGRRLTADDLGPYVDRGDAPT